MDYCHQCRRHLNGALTCAGCGTPAEELRQRTSVPPAPPRHRHPGEGSGADERHEESAAVPEGDIGLVGGHRRDRRSAPARKRPRRARSKRGRRILVGVLGLVLAGAALSLAELARESSRDNQATSVKEEKTVDLDGGPQDTAKPADPGDPGPAPTPGEDGTGTGSPSPGTSDAPSPNASKSPDTSASTSDSPSPDVTDSPEASSSSPDAPSTGSSTPTGPTGEPTTARPTSARPTPEPEPTETCTRILWWCA